MKMIKFFLLIFTVFSVINFSACGGGSGGGGGDGGGSNTPPPTTSADAASAVQATMMLQETTIISNVDTSLITNLASKPAILGAVAGSISQIASANGWIAMVQGFQLLALQSTPVQTSVAGGGMSIFAAGNSWTWSTTSGSLTITFRMNETTTSNYDWSLTFNGTYNGQSYNNYSIASGQVSSGRMTIRIRPLPSNPLLYLFCDMWSNADGSSAGYCDYQGLGSPYYYSWTKAADGTLDIAVYQIVSIVPEQHNKLLGVIIRPDGTGSFDAYCPSDWQLAADGTFTAYGLHGSACGYATACGQPDDPPCGSW
jgi:hypothetical protein